MPSPTCHVVPGRLVPRITLGEIPFLTIRRHRLNLAVVSRCVVAALAVLVARSGAAQIEAYVGQPFGVGKLTVSIDRGAGIVATDDPRLTVADAAGRVLYPVASDAPARRLLRQILEIETPASTTIYFLFRGAEPFELVAYGPAGRRHMVTPRNNPSAWSRTLREWWEQTSRRWQQLDQDPQFPPIVENYLVASLARRLSLPQPQPKQSLLSFSSAGPSAVDELLANERQLLAIDREMLAEDSSAQFVDAPLPTPMPWYDLDPPVDAPPTAVEPLALHAPAECLYLRFGAFSNYLWFRDWSEQWQNDLGNMILRRSIRRDASKRIEQQLAIRQTAMSKILGPQVIADVAIVGLDPYLSQGAAIGMLFQAKNNFLLSRDLMEKRREALAKFPDATESEFTLGGAKVNLIAAPGGEVRSYYVQDGDFHLVTTSRRLAQRFLEAGQGIGSLAASPGFLHVRQRIPFDADSTLFAYAAPEMFRELTSPASWIERRRRLRSLREAKLLELAKLQAAAEGVAATDLAGLVAAGLLPAGFGARSDGSELVLGHGEAPAVDSRRGAVGYFTPVADMEVAGVTATEAAAYVAFADRFRQQCGQFPPIAVSLKRQPRAAGAPRLDGQPPTGGELQAGDETILIEAIAAPLERVKLGKLPDMLGNPSDRRIAWLPGDLANLEVVVDAVLPLGPNAAEQYQLFLGVRDFSAEMNLVRGEFGLPLPDQRQAVKAYWGSWPKPGLLGLLGNLAAAGAEPQPDQRGGFVARQDDVFLGSFSPTLLREVLPQLTTEPVGEPAQVWLRVGQIAGTGLENMVNKLSYSRVLATSRANSRLLGALAAQLHVPPDQCLIVAERLMDGQLVCPLGGEYQLAALEGRQPYWTSTVVAPANQFLLTQPPADFQLPLIAWFEGARADARLDDDSIRVRAELDVDGKALPESFAWPRPPAAPVEEIPAPPDS
ncbi:MAG: hypothetical protein KF688_19015 [Pirellulales bacterium]|nr:hypothetical protein [Pirellulales bacterium]